MELDPGIHIAMHSVLPLKPGMTIKQISNIYGGVMQSEKKLFVTKLITFITIA